MIKQTFGAGYVLFFALFFEPATAADIAEVDDGTCSIRLSGIIEAGDDEVIASLVTTRQPDPTITLCLDSPGGSFVVGIEIARIVHERGIGTLVEDYASCESSCAVIFFMGTSRQGGQPSIDREVMSGAEIGIHSPSLFVDAEAAFLGRDVIDAFDLAMQAAGSITTLGQITDGITGDNWIPIEVMNHLLNTPAMDMFVIHEVGQAQEWNVALASASWPEVMSNEFAWNMCNHAVRERLSWPHIDAPQPFEVFSADLENDPVTLEARFLRGQSNPHVVERFQVTSAYSANGLRFTCVLASSYPNTAPTARDMTACIVPIPASGLDVIIRCDDPNDTIPLADALAGYSPNVRLEDIEFETHSMEESGQPVRARAPIPQP